jgi:hypothetical protein
MIVRLPLLAIIAVLAALDCAQAADALPGDVARYIDRRTGCNYWPSEPATDKTRKAEIQRHIRDLHCSTLDHEEALLQARYQDRPEIVKAIDDAHDAMPD